MTPSFQALHGGLLFVNYHHVRPENPPLFPSLHHITPLQLKAQIELLAKDFDFVDPCQIRRLVLNKQRLSSRICILTFDDGLKDHFDHVQTVLHSFGIKAVFSINTAPWETGRLLSVHMAHLLSAAYSYLLLLEEIEAAAVSQGVRTRVPDVVEQAAQMQYRYDDLATAKVKYFLNAVVPQSKREKVLRTVFSKKLGDDTSYVEKHYLSPSQVKEIFLSGHTIALHSHSHMHLASATEAEVTEDLKKNHHHLLTAISKTGNDLSHSLKWISYPYGSPNSYSPETIRIASQLGCDMGLTMRRAMNLSFEKNMELARIDCNDAIGGKAPIILEALKNG